MNLGNPVEFTVWHMYNLKRERDRFAVFFSSHQYPAIYSTRCLLIWFDTQNSFFTFAYPSVNTSTESNGYSKSKLATTTIITKKTNSKIDYDTVHLQTQENKKKISK